MSKTAPLPDGWRLIEAATLDSTNAEILRRAEAGEPEGLAVRADVQTAGRGRRGRVWVSPLGNLYLSILVDAPPATAGQAGFAASLALADAIDAAAGVKQSDLRLKWPNDLLYGGAKVAGLLLGAVPERDQVVVGIGVNLRPVDVDDAVYPIGDLSDLKLDAGPLAYGICRSLAVWLQAWRDLGFAPLRRAWLDRAVGLMNNVTVRLPNATFDGTFRGLAEDGALLLDQGAAGVRSVAAGDVFFSSGV